MAELTVIQQLSWIVLFAALWICGLETASSWKNIKKHKQHPSIGKLTALTPLFILNAAFARNASKLILQGYQQFKLRSFKLLRGDGSVVLLPLFLLDELSTISSTIASPHGALEHDLLGKYTGLDIILENRLHHTIVQRKLTPRLSVMTPALQRTLAASFKECFPKTDEWVRFKPYEQFCRVAARLSAEAIVGPSFSHNETWLNFAVDYTESLFKTIVVLRSFPEWMYPLLYRLLPSYWRCQGYIKTAKSLLGPQIQELITKNDEESWTPSYEDKDLNVLTWLSVLAKGRDRNPESIAHVQVLIALAAVHTTVLRMVNVLYDITAAGPALLEELREEINTAVNEYGWEAHVSAHSVGNEAVVQTIVYIQNGLHVSQGTYVCMPTYAIENDPEYTPNPELFDGLRSYRQTVASDKQDGKAAKGFRFTNPAPTVLNFGYGKTACPGRFFAGLILKMLFARFLTQYDCKFLPSTKRPANMMVHEFLFPNPGQEMLIKENHRKQHNFEA